MTFALPEWRALAFGYAAGGALLALHGLDWWVPVTATVVAAAVRFVWR